MKKKVYTFTAVVEQFPQKGGWIFVRAPQTYRSLGIPAPKWGQVPVTFTMGDSSWQKSLLPLGDGTLFVPFTAQLRRNEKVVVGDTVTVSYTLWR